MVKYTRLLRETNGIGDEDVRCILLSTDWRELDAVITDFQAMTNFHVGCYEIRISQEGTSLEVSPHNVVQTANRLEVFYLRAVYLTISEERRQGLQVRLRDVLAVAGITSAAILSLRYKGENANVYIGYGLYLAVAEVSPTMKLRITRTICDEMDITSDDIEVITYEDYIYAEITDQCAGLIDEVWLKTADELPQMLETWHVDEVLRIGRFGANRKLGSDAEVTEMLYRKSTIAQFLFSTITSPKLKSSWRDAVSKVLQCVHGIDVWEHAVKAFLNRIEQNAVDADVGIHVYCPCDIFMAMFQLVGRADARYMPDLEISYKSLEVIHILKGTIVWDGTTYPDTPEAIIQGVCGSDWWAYYLIRNVPAYEELITHKHGLSYAVAEWSLGDSAQGFWLNVINGSLQKVAITDEGPKPFHEFLNGNGEYLNRLVERIEMSTYFS